MRTTLALLSLLILTARAGAASDGFRCPDTRALVRVGDSTLLVRNKCREPDGRSERYETKVTYTYHVVNGRMVRVPHEQQVYVEDWLFDFGKHDFIRQLRFEDGTLHRVSEGGYGGRS